MTKTSFATSNRFNDKHKRMSDAAILNDLEALVVDIPPSLERENLVSRVRRDSKAPVFVLNTCQRLEIYGHGLTLPTDAPATVYRQSEAFERLCRIAAGLESRILGELEILGQVRDAYRNFHELAGQTHTHMDRLFQDIVALARKARRESGIDKNLTSLSGVSAREMINRVPAGVPVAVIGSGSLAAGVTRYLGKRADSPVRVSSRCPEKAMQLAALAGGFGAGLDKLAPLLEGVGGIICATAAPHPVLYPHHLETTSRPLTIIDLSVPPDCHDDVTALDRVTYLSLADIEQQAQGNAEHRRESAQIAGQMIRQGAREWSTRH